MSKFTPTMNSEQITEDNDPNVEAEEWGEEYDGDGDEGMDEAEAEAIARRLGEELWADISKARANLAVQAQLSMAIHSNSIQAVAAPCTPSETKEGAAIKTMKTILQLVDRDPLARTTLSSTIVPDHNGANVLDVMNDVVTTGNISRGLAATLGEVVLSLAKSDTLFGSPRVTLPNQPQVDLGKRKRDAPEGYEVPQPARQDIRVVKRPYNPSLDLNAHVVDAVRIITQALVSQPVSRPPDPSLVASIQLPLYQVFLFAVTSSAGGGPEMSILQEISGLIQVIGVLSGTQIGPSTSPGLGNSLGPSQQSSWLAPGSTPGSNEETPSPHTPFTDIGTAVYPCLVPGCLKIFSRLYSLRAHQRIHAVHRPFHCTTCPASFARNHDLKRHMKLHEKKAWKCRGCLKVFSRRDAIKRHKNNLRTKELNDGVCIDADVEEVDLDENEVLREEKRARMWSGGQLPTGHGHPRSVDEPKALEDGEVHPHVISQAQKSVASLHTLLQAYVSNALRAASGEATSTQVDGPTVGQATLASVIARAQSQNLTLGVSTDIYPDDGSTADVAMGIPPSLADAVLSIDSGEVSNATQTPTPLSVYGLSDEQTKLLEQAIANATSAAQAQAETEATLEEEYDEDEGFEDVDGEQQIPSAEG